MEWKLVVPPPDDDDDDDSELRIARVFYLNNTKYLRFTFSQMKSSKCSDKQNKKEISRLFNQRKGKHLNNFYRKSQRIIQVYFVSTSWTVIRL